MASASNPAFVKAAGLAAILLLGIPVAGQTPLTLEQAASREGRDFRALYEGREVILRGKVSVRVIPIVTYAHLAIQDDTGHGFTIDGAVEELTQFSPGDVIVARGQVLERAGLPVLHPAEIRIIDKGPVVEPRRVPLGQLNGFRYEGVFVVTEGLVRSVGTNEGGHFLLLGNSGEPVKVFLPYAASKSVGGLTQFRVGDRVRATGISSQYAPLPPYNRYFQLTIPDAGSVELVERRWPIPVWALIAAVGLLLGAVGVWSMRERNMAARRRSMRRLYQLGEEMVAALSPEESLHILKSALPDTLGIASVRMYLYDHSEKRLWPVSETGGGGAAGRGSDSGILPEAVATCWRNRSLLLIPDIRRSPFQTEDASGLPVAAMFVPMFAQTEAVGVLEIDDKRRGREFSADEQAVAQHLANQIAIGIELRERQSIRDQLFRSEKLAATGQLISSVAGELKAPLAEIERAAGRLRGDAKEVGIISSQARRAADVVDRLLAFARKEEGVAPFDLTPVLQALLQSREQAWKERGIRFQNRLSSEPIFVAGSRDHLQQVLLSLITHAEESALKTPEKTVTVRETSLARGVQIEIAFSDPVRMDTDPFGVANSADGGVLGLGVCRSIVRGQGGDLRVVVQPDGIRRFEIELKAELAAAGTQDVSVPLAHVRITALLVESDGDFRRRLAALLSEGGHRAVPAATAEEALEIAGRFRFQAIFCSTRLAGMDCVELLERTRDRVDAFVFLSESYNGEGAHALQRGEGYVLTKPVTSEDLDRVLLGIREKLAARPL
jgi:signal transduction histidine kinase